ncbi:MAG: PEP-CTERM sorting domain-containing protein [Candidatus Eisenbacteria bacterium]|nr:PEP-CTERM sorting domain-containing protein [Candidatus Eisenbacteria bacterium]
MKLGLIVACLGVLAVSSPAAAYVQPGSLIYGTHGPVTTGAIGGGGGDGYKVPQIIDDGRIPAASPVPGSVSPASGPVPEPGTMAMASMGLIALGATLRRRRGR